MPEFERPKGWRFEVGGVGLRDAPDALPPTKLASGLNIRSNSTQSVQGRPGTTVLFTTKGNPVTDVRGYATLGTDDLPRFLARDTSNHIFLDNGVQEVALAGSAGLGVSMISFRPGASPESWMYIAGLGDYQKLSAPDAGDNVTAYKVGVAEPQVPVDVAPYGPKFIDFSGVAVDWTQGGGGGAVADGTSTLSTAVAIFADPALATRYSVQVSNAGLFLRDMLLYFNKSGGGTFEVVCQEVLPELPQAGTIQAIRYEAGATGKCVIVPSQLPLGPGGLPSLQRGSLVNLKATEVVMVLGVIEGPQGTFSIETSTAGTFAPGDALVGVPAIVVDGISALVVGQNIDRKVLAANIGVGTSTFSKPLAASPFATAFAGGGFPQNDDYFHILISLNVLADLTQVVITLNVGPVVDYVSEVMSYTISPADFQSQTAFGNAVFSVPLTSFVPGDGVLRSLATCNGIRVQVDTTASGAMDWGMIWDGGGGQPDIGTDGTPYQYRIVPRSGATGAKGNSSPPMRYGANARRQNVAVVLPVVASALPAADSQVDTWDVFRVGGQFTSYQYLGSGSPGTTFVDQYFQPDLATGLESDNFEPWPSVGRPFSVTTGGGNTIVVTGDEVVVAGAGIVWPAEILRWLPGTLVLLAGQTAYTLRARPVSLSGTSYLFKLEENAGSASPATIKVNEPDVGRQILPYLWGPSDQGDVFGCGDPLRPGTISFSKSFAPDEVPDSFNLDLSPPSEPLLGGGVLRGTILVSSSKRWWALYPSFTGSQRYTQIGQSIGPPMIAPYTSCADDTRFYYWGKDGIYATDGGLAASLTGTTTDTSTTGDLYPLFPHEGVPGANVVRNGVTHYAPDYKRCGTFRLGRAGGYLFADYADSDGTRRTLTCDLRTGGWVQDSYPDPVCVHAGVEQQSGTLLTVSTLYPMAVLGTLGGNVSKETIGTGDSGQSIACSVATFEWDGGDPRSQPLFGDSYLECEPKGSAITVTPVSLGTGVEAATTVPMGSGRVFAPISLGGGQLLKYLGLQVAWTELANPVILHLWQHSVAPQVEASGDRAGDWTNCGAEGNKFFQGILLDADTFGDDKDLQVRDADTDSLHILQPALVNHAGRQTLAYSFGTPFLAHLVRDEPQDSVAWRKFGLTYVWEPSPEDVQTWETQFTAHGLTGFQHVARIEAAYSSVTTVTLALTSYDGTSPAVVTLPSTGGVYRKLLVTLTYNKGTLYKYKASSAAGFRMFLNDWTVWVAQWGRSGPEAPYRNLGGQFGDKAAI